MSDSTMKAIVVSDYGNVDSLVLETIPRPKPDSDEILIHVFSAGVNPIDWKLRSGAYKAFMPITFPWIPGLEVAGTVEETGEKVMVFRKGQAVFGIVNGGYAEYALAKAADITIKPENISFAQAAAIPIGALTAWQAVEDAGVQKNHRVMVKGAAGGVGHFVVQLAVIKGAEVFGTASTDNIDFVKSMGVKGVIDYRKESLDSLKDFDIVIDTVGGEGAENLYRILHKGGTYITMAGQVLPDKAKALWITAKTSGRGPATGLGYLADLAASKKLIPLVGAEFPLKEAAAAHRLSETQHGRGRIILHIA